MKHKPADRKSKGQAARTGSAPLPGWAPYAVFAVLTLVLFREFVVSRGLLFGTDVVALGYFARKLYVDLVQMARVFPLWNPYIFGGLPFVDAMHGDIFYPTTVLKFALPVHRAMGWKLVLHVFLSGVFAYAWLRHLKLSRAVSMFGGVTYMLAPVLVSLIYPGHDGKLFVTALTPLLLWVTDWAITHGGTWRFAMLSGVVALLIFTAHMQLAYFATWAVVALAVFRLAQARGEGQPTVRLLRRFGALAMAGAVGALAIGAVQVWTPVRYLTVHSQRVEKTTGAEVQSGYAYSSSWSLHQEEAFSLVVPEFIGANIETNEGTVNTYWGRNFFKLNHEYAGLIPLLLLPVAFMSRRRRAEVWFLTGIAAASLIYALGATTPLFRLFYWLVPGVKLFRAPSSIMFLFAIAVITAAALGLEGARKDEQSEDWDEFSLRVTTYFWAAAGFFLVLALLGSAGVLTDLWTSILYRDIDPSKAAALEANLPNIRRGLWLSALLVGAVAGAWHLRVRGTLREPAWLGVVIGLSIIDLWRVDGPFIRVVNPHELFPTDDSIEFLQARRLEADPFRVFPLPNAPYRTNHFALYGLEELKGHHGNELGRYRTIVEGERLARHGFRILRLLNVRYVVSGATLQGPGVREVHRGRRSLVYEVEGALPRAFLVSRFEVLPDTIALDRILSPGFDPAETAILDQEPSAALDPNALGRVEWVEHGINVLTLRVETSGSALLVVGDNYYPAWQATVDGASTPVLRADYTLRAIVVPAGSHVVRFEYRSATLRASVWTTLLSSLAVVGLVGGALFTRRRGRNSMKPGGGDAEAL